MIFNLYSRTHEKSELIALAMNLSVQGVKKVYGGHHIAIEVAFKDEKAVKDALATQGVSMIGEGE